MVTTGLLIDLLHAGCMGSSRDTWRAMAVCLMQRRDSGRRWEGLQWGPSWWQTQSPQQLPGQCPPCQGPAGVPGAHLADCERGKGGEAGALTPEAALCAELSFLSVKTPKPQGPAWTLWGMLRTPGKQRPLVSAPSNRTSSYPQVILAPRSHKGLWETSSQSLANPPLTEVL